MSIPYCFIAKGNIIICEYTEYKGTFQALGSSLLQKIERDTKGTMNCNEYTFYYSNIDDLTFVCLADQALKSTTAFALLDSLQTEFEKAVPHNCLNDVKYLCYNEQFQEKLQMKMAFYEKNPDASDDVVSRLQTALVQQKNVIIEASDLLQERGQKLEIIVSKAEGLSSESASFYKGAKKVTQEARCKKIKYSILLAVVVLLVIYLIFGLSCGWAFQCFKS